jgi:sulfur carrier protein
VITITLNGELRELDGEVDLDKLIDLFAMPRKRVAVELNKSVVRRAEWPEIIVRHGDRLEVVHLVGGG